MNFLNRWKWEVGVLLAGILLTLSFSPFNYAYLAPVSLLFAFLSLKDISPRRALLRGFLLGLGLFGLGVSWVYISIHDYGKAPVLASALLTAFFFSFWALFPALTAYLIVKLKFSGKVYTSRDYGCGIDNALIFVKSKAHKPKLLTKILKQAPSWLCNYFGNAAIGKNSAVINPQSWLCEVYFQVLLASSLWILIDYFRGYLFLNGFPWLQVAYSQLDTPLSGYIPLLGVYGCGFLLLFSSALVAEAIRQKKIWFQTGIILLFIWGGGIFLKTIQWTKPVGDPIKVTLIQGNIPQDQKWLPQNRIKTLFLYQKITTQHWNSDVIIWPETAIPAFFYQVEKFYLNPLEQQAKENKTDLIVSLPVKGKKNNEVYNTVMTLGENRSHYKKNHLLPFGEYLPLQPLSGWILGLLKMNLGNFTPGGESQSLMIAGGYPFATSICYEDAFASVFIQALPKAAFLVNVTNDAWFGDSIEPYQHMQIARMRALETGRYLLRTTNTGVTAVVDFKGKIVKQAPLFITTSITAEIVPMGGMTPFARLGDQTIIKAILLFTLILLFAEWLINTDRN